ncbi:hypothetical protein NEF87_004358 [Candidatus Lokiarchaeum ossiferum]|uniref:Roadblock/LAMTOR2 domain-containing protein n=1 Tax=Candidatus Lokiarchaeum ossiferum TaxID=2951803 RepID=A0ABY6HX22_9ARCH|nr:hypothetical protein NEF87_004358 [Candidatus Lokiarchaeum sp. B-35]
MDYEEFIFELLDAEPAVLGGAVIDTTGNLLYQTENWDLQQEIDEINSIIAEAQKPDGKNPGKIKIMEVGYMIIEFTPERIIATNVAQKGHIIVAIGDNGSIVAYIDPSKGPRDALFNVQSFSRKL